MPTESSELPQPPGVGELAKDARSGRIGRVMAAGDVPGAKGMWWLRPIGGGLEWPVDRIDLERVDEPERQP